MSSLETVVKSGKPWLPVSDAVHLAFGLSGVGVAQTETWGAFHRSTVPMNNVSIPIVDTGGANGGQGNLKIYTFPKGVIQIYGAMFNLSIQKGSGGLIAGAAVVGAVGSVAAGVGDATLTTTEADIVPSTVGTLTAGLGALKNFLAAIPAPFNGSTTPLAIFMNLAAPDASIASNDTLSVNGNVTLLWTCIGDIT